MYNNVTCNKLSESRVEQTKLFTNLDPLNLKLYVPVFHAAVKLRVAVDVVDCGHVVGNEGEDLFTSFHVDFALFRRVPVLQETEKLFSY